MGLPKLLSCSGGARQGPRPKQALEPALRELNPLWGRKWGAPNSAVKVAARAQIMKTAEAVGTWVM